MKINPSNFFVDVILPLALPNTFTYSISKEEEEILEPGFRVAVQFGKQKIYTAIVKKIHSTQPQNYEPKNISMIMDQHPLVTKTQLKFWEWISDYYMCSEGEVLRSSLPSALLIESKSNVIKLDATAKQIENLNDAEFLVYEALENSNLTIEQIEKIIDSKKVMPLILGMIKKKVASLEQSFEEKFIPKKERLIKLNKNFKNKKIKSFNSEFKKCAEAKRSHN